MVGRCHAADPVTKPGRSFREWNIGGTVPVRLRAAGAVTPFGRLSHPVMAAVPAPDHPVRRHAMP